METKINFNEEINNMTDSFQLNDDMAEFCGVIMGDGNLWSNNRKYEITITGNKIDDREYFDSLFDFISKKIKKKPYYRERGRGLRLTIYSKNFYYFINKKIGIPEKRKKRSAGIPFQIRKNKKFLKRFVRGVFDTDGTVFTSHKNGSPNYPTLEISNSNPILIQGIYESLSPLGLKVHLRKSTRGEFKLSLYGMEMLSKWNDKIGSSNPHKKRRINSILEHFD
jgi:hypothetical protein